MDNSNFHSTYNDYLIFKTTQNKSLRNQIIDPNMNYRHNLPLFINYQLSALRKQKNSQKIDYNSIHNKITTKIDKINELSLVNEKTLNFKNFDNFLTTSRKRKVISLTPSPDTVVKSLYNKIYKKNENVNEIDKYFTFQTAGSIPKKSEKKEKINIDKNLKLIMHDKISEKFLINLFKRFTSLQLKKNIVEEKKQKKLGEDPNALDFESRYETLYKKQEINNKEYSQTLRDLCRNNKINMSSLLELPEGKNLFLGDF